MDTRNVEHTSKMQKYIDVRISQLAEEAEKCNDEWDKAWFNKIIAELHWVSMAGSDMKSTNCPLEEKDL